MVLPEGLYGDLMAAAKMHSISGIQRGLDELEHLGEGGGRLAERMRVLVRRYDVKGIVAVLEGVRCE